VNQNNSHAVACWRRDQKCDIRIVNREVSRKHVQLEVDTDTGCVTLSSLGREPVSVNGEPAANPVELFTGDQIEVFAHTTGTCSCRSSNRHSSNIEACVYGCTTKAAQASDDHHQSDAYNSWHLDAGR
jgi:FHA domain